MTALPVDVALAVAGAGVDPDLHGDGLVDALRRTIADRGGSVHGPVVGDTGFGVELRAPHRAAFSGRTEERAQAESPGFSRVRPIAAIASGRSSLVGGAPRQLASAS